MIIKAIFEVEGVEYEYLCDTRQLDRNYDDEGWAYWIVEADNGFFFEINVWKDDHGYFKGEGLVNVYLNRGYFEDDLVYCQIKPAITFKPE